MSRLTLRELAIIAIALDEEQENKRRRRYWVHNMLKKRLAEGEYWKNVRHLIDDDKKFYIYFHMPKYLFYYILSFIRKDITKKNTTFRQAIPAEEKLAVTLRYLITGTSVRTLWSSFRIGESTIRLIIRDVCNAIINNMKNVYMRTPTTEEWENIGTGFNNKWNFPNCIGAIDGKHINIIAPANSGSKYFNYKKHFSIVLLAVVDDKCRFRVVDIGAFGRNSDGGIFASSKFGRAIENNTLNFPNDKPLPGTDREMPHVILGDEAFPLGKHLLRPYPLSQSPSDAQKIFNYRLSRARRVVENAFGILYQKFGIYNKNIDLMPKYVDNLVFASCILHNVMRNYVIEMNEDRNQRLFEQQIIHDEPRLQALSNIEENSSNNAFSTRDEFTSYFLSPVKFRGSIKICNTSISARGFTRVTLLPISRRP